MNRNQGIYKNVLDLVGQTPIIQLNNITKSLPGKYFAKLEMFNPGQSQKDRIALHIVENAEKKGILKPGSTIVETTSGNTGFSLAMISMVKGYKCKLAVSDKSSIDKIDGLRAMGAEVYICPANVPPEDPKSYYEVAKRIHRETPNSVYINQYFNDLNIEAHYATTGPEIWSQLDGKVDGFTCAVGTGGTLAGVSKYLKEKKEDIKIFLSDPYGSALYNYYKKDELKAEGNSITEGIGQGRITKNLENCPIDLSFRISDNNALTVIFDLLKDEGLFLGGSSGINVAGAIQLAKELGPGHTIVTILCDSGQRYQSKIWNPEFLKSKD